MPIIVIPTRDSSPQPGTDGKTHATAHGYDGENVWAWDCLCGAADTYYRDDDSAALGASIHMATIEIQVTEVWS